MSDHPARRTVLRATAGVVAGSSLIGTAASAEADTDSNPHDAVPTTPEEVRAAFDDVPKLEAPTDRERFHARHHFPDAAVPEEGPIPDPEMQTPVTLEAEPWVLASVYDQAQRHGDKERGPVVDGFLSRCQADECWVLPDGTDAVDAVVAALQEEPNNG